MALEIIDDDDDFDWDAAVREADVTCEGGEPSTSFKSEPCKFYRKARHAPRNLQGAGRVHETKSLAVNEYSEDGDHEILVANCAKRHVHIDTEAAKTWIYPVNIPVRDYQLSIAKTALFSNTLVALPTGLGKTLIAAVVMYNYFRWFPGGKIVFAAPSRPLVMQQIEACHNIMGIPQGWTIDMTGQTSPVKRARFWKERRIFFLTPQVLEKDIQSGTCRVEYLVCVVIDEAHRALGNYSYCVAIRELVSALVDLRIVALTATPGSKKQTIQNVIDNLLISTLEYRDESDRDVRPYVHNRKVELIEVAMCQCAVEVSNLLLEVIQPFVARLYTFGVLQRRDLHSLSPCDLVTWREKFRQAPPPLLDEMKFGEIEGYFGVLITLCYIRKLLSSHGIRPAFEMLEEKLKQGYFARLMSKNEVIAKVKLLMQKSLNYGAPDPKLVKLLEVLTEHFKVNEPRCSRVIIFSNFRGSVRDIMAVIGNAESTIRATEFIGQNSGKVLKGQTQKAQQAVLEKFRSGEYNVIVATCIGEEGLDIMEVDLVICFDANISPLRMIQRMGRTGRKHDGRVVVLACNGSEMNGYMRKQESNKAIGKHMRDGGLSSFTFHDSPRMVPHILKPQVQFMEMSIERYVPRGRKTGDRHGDRLSDAEAALLAKYFPPHRHQRPSLIAFPNFQTIPSPVFAVGHSSRTNLMVDAMRSLRESSAVKHRPPPQDECVGTVGGGSSNQCSGSEPPSPSPLVACDSCDDDAEFSPRLATFIRSGVVPESPMLDEETPCGGAARQLSEQTNASCSKDWCLSSGGAGGSRKFRRLQKRGDVCRRILWVTPKNRRRAAGRRGKNKNAGVFIEEEAEVSREEECSSDEEEDDDGVSHSDSFIDDAPPLSVSASRGSPPSFNVMAMYRRSLLSQSPYRRECSMQGLESPDSLSAAGGGPCRRDILRDSRRRREAVHPAPPSVELFDDDKFYAGLDFDVVEAEAVMLLRSRVGDSPDFHRTTVWPSFDLGI